MREPKRGANLDLPPVPPREQVLLALADLEKEHWAGVSAQRVAWRLGMVGARRLGNGAVSGSWSGAMPPALRIAPRLGALRREGVVESWYEKGRRLYALTKAGHAEVERLRAEDA